MEVLYSMLLLSSISMTLEASAVELHCWNWVYCGLVNAQIKMANVKITAAEAPTIMVFCLVVNLFHQASTLSNIFLILSGMIVSP